MQPHDDTRLRHMLDSAKEAVEFAAGKSRKDLDDDRKLSLAIIKSIEIIGEAASKVSEARKVENDNIPWRDIIGMRGRHRGRVFILDMQCRMKTRPLRMFQTAKRSNLKSQLLA